MYLSHSQSTPAIVLFHPSLLELALHAPEFPTYSRDYYNLEYVWFMYAKFSTSLHRITIRQLFEGLVT
jgi:hypothetical protein